ncbi:MAG: c-type cytochrome [Ignavibacteria bacterium]|nr:c-type cytochrome [Ignavibacteria bacterium]
MSFFDKLVLPQSLEHISLIQFLATLMLMIFIPYIIMLIYGTLLSLVCKYFGKRSETIFFETISKDIIPVVTVNKSTALILGLAPLLMLTLSYAQLFHNYTMLPVKFFILAAVLLLIGIVLVFTYRYSGLVSDILADKKSDDNSEASVFQRRVGNLYNSTGLWSILFLVVGLYMFTAGLSAALHPGDELTSGGFFSVVFSFSVLTRFVLLSLLGLTVSSSIILFRFFHWEGGVQLEDDYAAEIKQFFSRILFISSIVLPVFITLNTITMPVRGVSPVLFLFLFLAMVLVLISLLLQYKMLSSKKFSNFPAIFVLVLFTAFLTVFAEQEAMSNANYRQSLVLAQDFNAYKATLEKTVFPSNTMSGADIFKNKCSACHRFDTKLVGPPYKETLPKYNGDIDKLAEFIKNPVKKNPAYPAMPNQGLKPVEVRAIARYILQEVKKFQ